MDENDLSLSFFPYQSARSCARVFFFFSSPMLCSRSERICFCCKFVQFSHGSTHSYEYKSKKSCDVPVFDIFSKTSNSNSIDRSVVFDTTQRTSKERKTFEKNTLTPRQTAEREGSREIYRIGPPLCFQTRTLSNLSSLRFLQRQTRTRAFKRTRSNASR